MRDIKTSNFKFKIPGQLQAPSLAAKANAGPALESIMQGFRH
jgi:hypothetical protein